MVLSISTNKGRLTTQHAWICAPGDLVLYATSELLNPNYFIQNFDQTPVSKLINGVNVLFGSERFRYLRHDILTDYLLTPWDLGIIKVCAKRAVQSQAFEDALKLAHRAIDVGLPLSLESNSVILQEYFGKVFSSNQALREAVHKKETLVCKENLGIPRFNQDRRVVAMLLDNNDVLLGAAKNTNAKNQILHAEINLFVYLRSQAITTIPHGSKIICTLKPCRMCASLLLQLCEDPKSIKVYVDEDDQGKFGRHRLLEEILEFPKPIE